MIDYSQSYPADHRAVVNNSSMVWSIISATTSSSEIIYNREKDGAEKEMGRGWFWQKQN